MFKLIFLLSFSLSAAAQSFNIDFDFSTGALPPIVIEEPPPIDLPTQYQRLKYAKSQKHTACRVALF